MDKFIVLGKILGAYGVTGQVKIQPFDDEPTWRQMSTLWLCSDEKRSSTDAWRPAEIKRCRQHGLTLVANLEGIGDRNAAEALKGSLIGAPREALPDTAENEYYWADLIDLSVCTQQDEPLGVVTEMIETGANDVMRVCDDHGGDRLIPFVASVVIEVDRKVGRIVVDWGLDW